jgi:hypothetical protein
MTLSSYAESVLELLQNPPVTSDPAERYDIFVDIVWESAKADVSPLLPLMVNGRMVNAIN